MYYKREEQTVTEITGHAMYYRRVEQTVTEITGHAVYYMREEQTVHEITGHDVYYRREEHTVHELAVMQCTTGGRNRLLVKLLSCCVLQEGGTDHQLSCCHAV